MLGAAGPEIDGCRTALDVGAGFGALTLPLARRVRAVTLVAPPRVPPALDRSRLRA